MSAIRLREAKSHTLDEHINLLRSVVRQSMKDPESRMLAVALVSGTYDYKRDAKTGKETPTVSAWGKNFRAPAGVTCRARDADCEVERIWDFVVLNIRYVYDSADDDTFSTLKVMLLTGGEDCDGMTIAFATLLKHVGFHVVARVISTKEDPSAWVHIYPMVGLPKDSPTHWVPLDATIDGFVPGDEYKGIGKHRDFKL